MGDVDDSVIRHRDEGSSWLLEVTDHLARFFDRGICNRGDLGQRGRVTALATIVAELSEALEGKLRDPPAPIVGQIVICLVGMPGECVLESPGSLVMLEVDWPRSSHVPGPQVPDPHQGVLQHGQLVGIRAGVVQEPLHKTRCNRSAPDGDWTGDRPAELRAREPGNEIEPLVDRLRQLVELGTIPQVVRSHGQDHTHVGFVGGSLDQEPDECRIVRAVGCPAPSVLKSEQLLELVDHDQQAAASQALVTSCQVGETETASSEQRLRLIDGSGLIGAVSTEDVRFDEGPGQVANRIAARAQAGYPPVGPQSR